VISTDLEFDFVPDAIPFLEDWKIEQGVEMPFSASLEMVFAALLEQASPDRLPTLTEVFFHQPLIRGNGRLVHLQLAWVNQRFQIVSRKLDSPTERGIRHISGRFRFDTSNREIEKSSSQNSDYVSGPRLAKDEIYQRLKGCGLCCGQSFQAVNQLRFLTNGAVAQVELPKWLESDLDLYLVHPVLLSSALQLVSLATLKRDPISSSHLDLTRPAHIGSLTFYESRFENSWVEARIRETEIAQDNAVHFDVYFRDAKGHSLAVIKDMCLASCQSTTPIVESRSLTEHEVTRLIDEVVLLDGLTADVNLFSVGATSIDIIRIVNALESCCGTRIEFEAILANPTVKGIVDWYAHHSRQRADAGPEPSNAAGGADPEGRYPLSDSQKQIWFIEQLANTNCAYNELMVCRLTGRINVTALEQAFNDLVERHEILRTVIQERNGRLFQDVQPFSPLRLRQIELDAIPLSDREDQAVALAVAECRKPFTLSVGPLIRSCVIRLDQTVHLLVFVAHHIIVDGWSLTRVFFPELFLCYRARVRGESPELSPLSCQYKEYALYTQSPSFQASVECALAWWNDHLLGVPHFVEVSRDRARPLVQSHRGARHSFSIHKSTLQSLQAVAQKQETTLHVVLLSAFTILISRHGVFEDFCIGISTANRSRQSWESLIGCFMNLIPFRADLTGGPSIAECIARTHRTLIHALAHHPAPLSKIAANLQVSHSPAYNLLIQICFIYDSLTVDSLCLEGATVTPVSVDPGISKFDLTLRLIALPDRLEGSLEYATDIFQSDTIERLADHYLKILDAYSDSLDTRYHEVSMLTAYERRLILQTWNRTRTAVVEDIPVHRLFERQVDRTPEAPAVSFRGDTVSYIHLERRANRVARFLQSIGIEPGNLVAIDMPPSIDRIIGVLSILKAGAGYVPLDRNNPLERLSFIVSNSGAEVYLTQRRIAATFPVTHARMIFLEDILERTDGSTDERLRCSVDSQSPVYVIYTSGSTGKPKGVLMHHRPLVNLIQWQNRNSQMGVGSRTLQFSSFGFDVSFQETMSTLSTGGHLVPLPEEYKSDSFEILRYLNDYSIERLFLPFVALQQLAKAATDSDNIPFCLREIITAGEQLQINPTIVQFFLSLGGCQLINHYGPTETHITTHYRLSGQPDSWPVLPPIGRPIDNVEACILDKKMNPVAIGEVGELYLGGLCVALGYINNPEQTQKRFLSITSRDTHTRRLYRTGDLARFRYDGNIEFIGRIDDQVKIRGYRIEPAEIESAISSLGAVEQAAVIVKEYGPDDRRLIAYISQSKSGILKPSDIRSFLSSRLPDYMIPTSFVIVDRIPVTASGKVNRVALTDREPSSSDIEESIVPPRTQLEERLVRIWRETLKTNSVGIRDSFFGKGGNSLLLMGLPSAIKVHTGYSVTIAELLAYSTIEELASYLTTRDGSALSDRSSASSRYTDDLLICLKKGIVDAPPILFVHPMSGSALGYRSLADQIDTGSAIYGIQNHPLENKHGKTDVLERMAESYIDAVSQRGFRKPYYIVGHSIGGAIAYEMACRLSEGGQPIALLALIDTTIGWQVPPTLSDTDRLALILGDNLGMSLEAFRNLDGDEQLRHAARVLFDTSHYPVERAMIECTAMLDTARVNENALRHYKPRPYTGNLLYIKAKERLAWSVPNPENAWFELTKGSCELTVVGGNHVTMLAPPHVQEIAAELIKHCGTTRRK
jgi:amino acid adenylation domain-containing protein